MHLRCPFCEAYEVDRLYLASVDLDSCVCAASQETRAPSFHMYFVGVKGGMDQRAGGVFRSRRGVGRVPLLAIAL